MRSIFNSIPKPWAASYAWYEAAQAFYLGYRLFPYFTAAPQYSQQPFSSGKVVAPQ